MAEDADEKEEVLGWMRCHWDCPSCGEDNSLEGDQQGEDVTCTACGTVVHIYEVR